ncbi:hypothetical protein CTEN210_01026 [Chaetoceros tenuissimus]|uniref:Uncharacterized protein n=1 Tax=Chaetoceros tenuissimus TaxID=426638 RepID=A0AAD3GYY4_9STRA|nr:hypothetical protein CTEN210_01026 [Chaetoceros tenuissimus]
MSSSESIGDSSMTKKTKKPFLKILFWSIILFGLFLTYYTHVHILNESLVHLDDGNFEIAFDAASTRQEVHSIPTTMNATSQSNFEKIDTVSHAEKIDGVKQEEKTEFDVAMEKIYQRAKQAQQQCASSDIAKTSTFLTEAEKWQEDRYRSGNEKVCNQPPEEQSCAEKFTVVILFDFSSDKFFRPLFMNILTLQTLQKQSSTSIIGDILVVYNGSSTQLHLDKTYGRRILSWQKNKMIRLIDASEEAFVLNSISEHVKNNIILFLDGMKDIAHIKNDDTIGIMESLETGFQMARRYPLQLIGSGIYDYGIALGAPRIDSVNEVVEKESNFTAVCDSEKTLDVPIVMDLSGSFLHRNYLCFFAHERFQSLVSLYQSTTSKYEDKKALLSDLKMEILSMIVSILITQVSGSVPHIYPLVDPTWEEDKANASSNQVKHRRLSEVIDDRYDFEHQGPRRRRTIWYSCNEEDMELLPMASTEIPRRRLSSTQSTSPRVVQKMRYSSNIATRASNMERDDILSILNYFGSYVKDSSCWCNEFVGKTDTFDSQRQCRQQCGDDVERYFRLDSKVDKCRL